jgi:predicted dehydrogenase
MPRTVHDQVMIQGTLASGAVLSYHLRGGPAFDKAEGATWWIYGTNGQIKVTVSDSFFQITDDNAEVELFDHTSKSTEVVVVDKDAFSDMPVLYARNIARLYEAFADGKGESEGVRGFEHALQRHRFIDEVYAKAGVR